MKLRLNKQLILEELMGFRCVVKQQRGYNATPITSVRDDSVVL
jgi:hypothetical protein